jgi:ribosome biogenesis protein Tsr3
MVNQMSPRIVVLKGNTRKSPSTDTVFAMIRMTSHRTLPLLIIANQVRMTSMTPMIPAMKMMVILVAMSTMKVTMMKVL